MKQKLTRYAIATACGLLFGLFVLNNYGFSEAETALERYLILCDSFTIPGVILVMVGLLVWIGQQGQFDFLSYTGRMIRDRFRKDPEHIRYGDYVLEKQEKRHHGGFGFLIITGLAFVAVALVFLILFYSKY